MQLLSSATYNYLYEPSYKDSWVPQRTPRRRPSHREDRPAIDCIWNWTSLQTGLVFWSPWQKTVIAGTKILVPSTSLLAYCSCCSKDFPNDWKQTDYLQAAALVSCCVHMHLCIIRNECNQNWPQRTVLNCLDLPVNSIHETDLIGNNREMSGH